MEGLTGLLKNMKWGGKNLPRAELLGGGGGCVKGKGLVPGDDRAFPRKNFQCLV